MFYLFNFLKIHTFEVFASKKEFADHHILSGKEKDTFCRFTITSCAASFLVIVFHALRHVVVDDETHIGFVDSHAKSIGGNHNLSAVIDEIILTFFADIVAHSSVVTGYRDALFQ